ncbi:MULTISPECIES: arsenical pump-driving ATPase [Alphaproteobacteria]|uniref:Arsenical pump-driving ATPase n=2 Tax=Alphaproteobacteria TaxID=28211 RepID=A0A512HJ41_9HYPH|nr:MULTISPECIES: arsenical pump-driving ATPase [Alphaproteobacteria]GEO85457.1 arsenical pump-driving ATPase [Ciceribacter naphthalenivorans]GLR21521.1 arsenical pump-driving ATPase [Ciceribacter naphthalenivorans]GLT04377.1 arsenical pump-driving ATPase [Sphingomonas psychrolutea]
MIQLKLLTEPNRHLFFTGKGGVGKTSISCATAIALADKGLKVLLVSTDPASNLDEMLGVVLDSEPKPVPGVPGLFAMNIDPEAAAEDYRRRVLDQMGPTATDKEKATVREQLSGACTTEIAAFDEFVGLLGDEQPEFDHIIFDTAPTGHTLRLLSLPKAWTGFLEANERGASCLGPHSGLKMQEDRFREALECLGDPARTTVVLVTRAERGAIREAARTAGELNALGLSNQMLAVNGRFTPSDAKDTVAAAFAAEQTAALAALPAELAGLPRDEVPLQAFDMVGLDALRALFVSTDAEPSSDASVPLSIPDLPRLSTLIAEIAASEKGLVMVMGKGGVGKTTIAAAVAVGLAARGHSVHLTTTDPAAHVSFVVGSEAMPGLTVDRIDPEAETKRYIDKIMATKGRDLDEDGKALLREDLASPCTEEVAVFHAFSRVVGEARSNFVVIDTAPTGHTLLLLDATGAYHRQMTRHLDENAPGRMVTPLMRLQDPAYTRVLLVTLPETTPVSEAGALQEDLRRAKIEPYGWVINKSMAITGTRDPLLRTRIKGEAAQIERVKRDFANRVYALDFRAVAPVGLSELRKIGDLT